MAHKFNEEDKVVKEFSDRLGFGVHKVQLMLAEAGESDEGKTFIELNVVNEEATEDKARLWFVGGASQISFNTLRQIVVHNAKTEEQKATARDAVDACKDTDEMVALLNDKCQGGELWFTKYYDPKRTYISKTGETKRSINTNVYGYAPAPKPELMPTKGAADLVHDATVAAKEVPFASASDAPGSTVPKDDAWS